MRLIDAEEAIVKQWMGNANPIAYRQYAVDVLKKAPTIDVDKIMRSDWISCKERLPECYLIRDVFSRPQCYMSDSVLVTVKSDECDGIHYFVSTDYMSGKTKEDAHWMMSCGYGGSGVNNQEIIAWMYKPNPYRG